MTLNNTLDYPGVLINTASEGRARAVHKEPETVAWIEANLEQGKVFYDIGANIGAYSLIAAKFSHNLCPIYAFEPGFPAYGALCDNTVLNNAVSIVPMPFALSDKTGMRQFDYSSMAPTTASHGFHVNGGVVLFSRPVPTYRLDALIGDLGLPQPDLVKIDVDGHEVEVAKGAEIALARARSVLIEVDSAVNFTAKPIEDIMSRCGFRNVDAHRHSATFSNWIYTR